MEKFEFKAATVEEAVELGLKELNITKDRANISILQEGTVFKKARVEISRIEEVKEAAKFENKSQTEGEKAVNFIETLTKIMNVDCELNLTEDDEKIDIFIRGEHTGALIGYRGDVLDSIQYLTSSIINNEKNGYKRVIVDCENYREKRAEILAALARRLAEKAIRTGRKVSIEPMNPSERKIIHSTLQENPKVSTLSEGIEPNRHIIITPKELRNETQNYKSRDFNDRKNFNESKKRQPDKETEKRPAYKTGFGSFLGNTKTYKE